MNNELKAALAEVNQLTARAKKTPMFSVKPVLEALADAQAKLNGLVVEALSDENRTA